MTPNLAGFPPPLPAPLPPNPSPPAYPTKGTALNLGEGGPLRGSGALHLPGAAWGSVYKAFSFHFRRLGYRTLSRVPLPGCLSAFLLLMISPSSARNQFRDLSRLLSARAPPATAFTIRPDSLPSILRIVVRETARKTGTERLPPDRSREGDSYCVRFHGEPARFAGGNSAGVFLPFRKNTRGARAPLAFTRNSW